MADTMRVSDPVAEIVREMSDEKDISNKEAISRVFIDAGYDV